MGIFIEEAMRLKILMCIQPPFMVENINLVFFNRGVEKTFKMKLFNTQKAGFQFL